MLKQLRHKGGASMAVRSDFFASRASSSLARDHGRSRLGPEYLLLPASPWFIWFTILAALMVNLLPFGRIVWLPDFLAIVLVFWNVHQPRRVGIGVAFVFGLIMDVHSSALLGQNALSYSALSFFAITIHRRIIWFSQPAQSLHVLPLFIAAQLLELLVRMLAGGQWPGLGFLIAPLLEAALWPIATALLLAPQRRPVDADKNRPVL
jgi:rod shape-determining protein MreD